MGEEAQRNYAAVADLLAETLDSARAERDRRRAAGQDTAWLEELLRELSQAVEQFHDLDVFQRLRAVVERHGPGPWPPEDLAAMADVDDVAALRVLEQMVRAGLAEPPGAPQ